MSVLLLEVIWVNNPFNKLN